MWRWFNERTVVDQRHGLNRIHEQSPMPDAAKPNLLFIFSDQHAQRVAGCYGDRVVETPALDRLAARGVMATNAYSASPICVPSRMSMLTACHPHRQEVWTNDDVLASDRPTWLHALGAAGYRPKLIGRLHALGPDQLHGYAERSVGDHSPNWPGVARHDMGVLAKTNDPNPESIARSGAGQSAYELKDKDVTAATLAELDRLAAIDPADREPFCLTVGLMLPHAPYVAAADRVQHYLDRLAPPRLGPDRSNTAHPWISWWREDRGLSQVDPADEARARAAYWALVAEMDIMIGRILDRLDATGLSENTLVVYASDHGDHVGERGLWWKHTFYDESIKVPAILSWPGRLPEGVRFDRVVSLMDLAQTMIEALGGNPLPDVDGRSFWRQLNDQAAPWIDEVFAEYCTDAVPDWTGGDAVRQRMIRQGRWKLIYYWGHRPQLFDLEGDPDETEDLALNPEYSTIVEALTRRVMDGWDPAAIDHCMKHRRRRKDLLGAWAKTVRPGDQYRWSLTADMNRLDGNRA